MNSRLPILAVAAMVALALGIWLWRIQSPPQLPPAPLAGSDIGGPFALIDQDGRPFTDAKLKGKWTLMYFGYTYCPDICPLDTQKLSTGLTAFEKADARRGAMVQPVFVSVDPARDTPAAVKEFTANFHPRLIGLTGSQAQVDAALKEYRVYARRAGPPGATDYLVDHLAVFYLFDPAGQPISYLGHDATAADITRELTQRVG